MTWYILPLIISENEERGHTSRENDLSFLEPWNTCVHNSKKHYINSWDKHEDTHVWTPRDTQQSHCIVPKHRAC